MPTALITGVTGQDGAFLARLLLERGYRVIGTHRPSAAPQLWRLQALGIAEQVELRPLDLTAANAAASLVADVAPQEIYNLAAQSFVGASFRIPIETAEIDAVGVLRLLEAVREHAPEARFFQASSNEMFGLAAQCPQNEETPFAPRNPYAAAKLFAHHSVGIYRDAYGLHAVSGILYNHESELRGEQFVTRKITLGIARIVRGEQQQLALGNLDASKDWGYAGDMVEGMWRALQRQPADDYVFATGVTHTVREFVSAAATAAGLSLRWQGAGEDEVALDEEGRVRVRVDPSFFRPLEPGVLCGDAAKAARLLDWRPTLSFEALVARMVRADLERLERPADAKGER